MHVKTGPGDVARDRVVEFDENHRLAWPLVAPFDWRDEAAVTS
jgi:hypothetical protein